jgi:hypothetical protein
MRSPNQPPLPRPLPNGAPDRDALRSWVDQVLRGVTSEDMVLMELVRAGLELDEAYTLIKSVKHGRAGEQWIRTREAELAMSNDRRPALWPLLLGLSCLVIGVGGWMGSRMAARANHGFYFVPVGAIAYGSMSTIIGLRRWRARRSR